MSVFVLTGSLFASPLLAATNESCEQAVTGRQLSIQSEQDKALAQFFKAHIRFNGKMPQVGSGIELGMALNYINSPYNVSLLLELIRSGNLYEQVARTMNSLHAASNISHRAQENSEAIASHFKPVSRERLNTLIVNSYLLLIRDVFRILEKTWDYAPKEFYDVKEPFMKTFMSESNFTNEGAHIDWDAVKSAAQYLDNNSHRFDLNAVSFPMKTVAEVLNCVSGFMNGITDDSTELGQTLLVYRTALSKGDLAVRSRIQMRFTRLLILEMRKQFKNKGGDDFIIRWVEVLLGPISPQALDDMFPDLQLDYGPNF